MLAGHRVARAAWLGEEMPERWVAKTRVAGVWGLFLFGPMIDAKDTKARDWRVIG